MIQAVDGGNWITTSRHNERPRRWPEEEMTPQMRHFRIGRGGARGQSHEVARNLDQAEIRQIDVVSNEKFSHGCKKLGLLSGHVLDLTEGFNMNKTMRR